MNKSLAISALNTLVVVDEECDGETCYYVSVQDTERNRKVLKGLGLSDSQIDEAVNDDGNIDIEQFAWDFGATWYDPKQGFTFIVHSGGGPDRRE